PSAQPCTRTVIRSGRRAASLSCARKPPRGKFVTNRPPPSPGAVMSAVASSRPSGLPRSIAIDFLPFCRPSQYRLGPASGTRGQLVVRKEAAAREVRDEQAAAFARRGNERGGELAPLGAAEVDRDRLLAFLQALPVQARAAVRHARPAIEVGASANGVEADHF